MKEKSYRQQGAPQTITVIVDIHKELVDCWDALTIV